MDFFRDAFEFMPKGQIQLGVVGNVDDPTQKMFITGECTVRDELVATAMDPLLGKLLFNTATVVWSEAKPKAGVHTQRMLVNVRQVTAPTEEDHDIELERVEVKLKKVTPGDDDGKPATITVLLTADPPPMRHVEVMWQRMKESWRVLAIPTTMEKEEAEDRADAVRKGQQSLLQGIVPKDTKVTVSGPGGPPVTLKRNAAGKVVATTGDDSEEATEQTF